MNPAAAFLPKFFVISGVILILSGAFGVAWSGVSFVPALLTKNEQATGTLSLLLFPIAFMSTAFVPTALMPEWLQTVNQWNPISYVIEVRVTRLERRALAI